MGLKKVKFNYTGGKRGWPGDAPVVKFNLKKIREIGWEAKRRQIELTIERPFKGDELLRRMKGWITVEPNRVIEIVNKYGKLKVLDDRELVIEMDEAASLKPLQKDILAAFGSEVDVELKKE